MVRLALKFCLLMFVIVSKTIEPTRSSCQTSTCMHYTAESSRLVSRLPIWSFHFPRNSNENFQPSLVCPLSTPQIMNPQQFIYQQQQQQQQQQYALLSMLQGPPPNMQKPPPPKSPEDPEHRSIIDNLAKFVARNGPEVENLTKMQQQDNPKFQFLFGGEFYSYYVYRLNSEREIRKLIRHFVWFGQLNHLVTGWVYLWVSSQVPAARTSTEWSDPFQHSSSTSACSGTADGCCCGG